MSVSGSNEKNTVKKFRDVYRLLSESHVEDERVELPEASLDKTPFYLTVGAAAQGNVLMEGPPGHGKTTLSELASSLAGGVPLEAVKQAKMGPSDDEKAGTLHLGKLQEGEEEVLFNKPVFVPDNITDELNRDPPEAQKDLLDQVDRNRLEYRGITAKPPEGAFYATQNPLSEEGTYALPSSMEDRFDVAVNVSFPGHLNKKKADIGSSADLENILEGYSDDFIEIMEDSDKRTNPAEAQEELEDLREEYAEWVEEEAGDEYGLEVSLPTPEDREAAAQQIDEVSLDVRADLFLRYVDYRIRDQAETVGGRATESARLFSSAAAWLTGNDEASKEVVEEIVPNVYSHRVDDQSIIDSVMNEYVELRKPIHKVEKVWRNYNKDKMNKQEASQELERLRDKLDQVADAAGFVDGYLEKMGYGEEGFGV